MPATWFQQRYRQVSLYYFDPIAQILVPEPVFVPQGDQARDQPGGRAARGSAAAGAPGGALVRAARPRGGAVRAGRRPRGRRHQPGGRRAAADRRGVRVDAGPARVDPAPGPQHQGAARDDGWGGPADPGWGLAVPGGRGPGLRPRGRQGHRSGSSASAGGRLVSGTAGDLSVATGPFGRTDAGLVAVAVRPDASEAAGVDAGGSRVRLAPVRGDESLGRAAHRAHRRQLMPARRGTSPAGCGCSTAGAGVRGSGWSRATRCGRSSSPG
ncbi:hypothetical protein [Nocardioides convexus]|uniref:hypothetical protein n=1 Tax=Nocardioides convexus TaxID=2712224 RepID=UPI0024184A96|nr:hypothetical protein [Nocardioides convexus]